MTQKTTKDYYEKYSLDSEIALSWQGDVSHPDLLRLELSGGIGATPAYRKQFGTLGKSNRSRSYWDNNTTAKLRVMTECWEHSVQYSGFNPDQYPVYRNTKLFMLLLIGRRKTRFDSHNVPKMVCDWMEDVEIVDDDRHIECLPIRLQAIDKGTQSFSTSIILMPFDRIKTDITEFIQKVLCYDQKEGNQLC